MASIWPQSPVLLSHSQRPFMPESNDVIYNVTLLGNGREMQGREEAILVRLGRERRPSLGAIVSPAADIGSWVLQWEGSHTHTQKYTHTLLKVGIACVLGAKCKLNGGLWRFKMFKKMEFVFLQIRPIGSKNNDNNKYKEKNVAIKNK